MGHYVYKYVFNGEIIYIGKCDSDLDQRLAQHGKPGDNIEKKYWDDINASDIYYCTLANATMSDVVESELINRHKPKCNTAKKSDWDGLELPEPKWKKYDNPKKVPFVKKGKDLTKISNTQLKKIVLENLQYKIAVDEVYPVIIKRQLQFDEEKKRHYIVLHSSDFNGFITENISVPVITPDLFFSTHMEPFWLCCCRYFYLSRGIGRAIIYSTSCRPRDGETRIYLFDEYVNKWREWFYLCAKCIAEKFYDNLAIINANKERYIDIWDSYADTPGGYEYILSGIHINKSITDEEIVNILKALKTFYN